MENLESRIVNTETLQQKAKKFIGEFQRVVDNKRINWKVMIWLGILWFLILIYMVIRLLLVISDLNSKTNWLVNLDTYDTRLVQTNQYTKSLLDKEWTILDLVKAHSSFTTEIKKYQDYINNLNVPYEYFLQYIYLPHLNIRKNIYTDKIDVDMVWKNFLENNPYNDIFLLQKWSDFFKNVWDNNESNDIKNVRIWEITENKEKNLFSIPVSLSFESKSKRSFLLLVDKISVTSNKTTLSLINEFFYYLWQEIKAEKKSEIASLKQQYASDFTEAEFSDDKVIWYHLYSRIYFDKENNLIDKKIIEETIKKVSYCDKENNEMCYYKFREKYRDIPTFGYLIWSNSLANSVTNFKNFILSLPPVFSVKQFTFNQLEINTDSSNMWTNRRYKGNITIDVYGKGMSEWDLEEISKKLWEVCYSSESVKPLYVDVALESVNEIIKSLSDIEKKDTSDSTNLRDLKEIIEQISKEYNDYTNYRKVIKLFEIYRMMKNIGLCK